MGSWTDDTPGIKLVREIAKKYKRKPKLTSLYIGGIGVSMLFAEGIKRAGKDLTPDTLKDALETFRGFDTGGIFPPVTYTTESHAPAKKVRLFKADVEKKCLVPLTGWRSPKEF